MNTDTFRLFTVPHTGTHFIIDFLSNFGITREDNNYLHIHARKGMGDNFHNIKNLKCVVTARDPYLSAIRYIHGHRPVSMIADQWDIFLDVLPSLNYYLVDIGCTREHKESQLHGLCDFLGITADDSFIKKYAAAWKPQNSSSSAVKDAYLKTRELPKTQTLLNKMTAGGTLRERPHEHQIDIDWTLLDRAVAWYRSLPTNDYR